jgi:hypothetical protein
VAVAVATGESLGVVGLARSEQASRMASMDLVARQHRQGGQRVQVVVPD